MNITAQITGIKYLIKFADILSEININEIDINSAPASFILNNKKYFCGVSKWVSPKRTRSYPYERVYKTLTLSKRITVIPVIKDEGINGDRDFIQWDTVSLMSLLDVNVIFAYYNKADRHQTIENKITKQEFDNEYVKSKILEICSYHSSALHWNLKEITETLPTIINIAKESYSKIQKELGVQLHSVIGVDKLIKQFEVGVNNFMQTSRDKAKRAQNRELQTTQPKEALNTKTKATITIENYLGGKYYFTIDEVKIHKKDLLLIESKHSQNSKLPSIGDIKDGLLKMILYSNLNCVKVANVSYQAKPILKLTSTQISEEFSSNNSTTKINKFISANNFNNREVDIVKQLLEEAKNNNFTIIFAGGQVD